MRIYIAGPMGGLPRRNVDAFDHAAAALREAGFEVTCPSELHGGGWPPPDAGFEPDEAHREYLRIDLRHMLSDGGDGCRGMALLDGWHNSKGANIERDLARTLGMPAEPVELWLHAAALARGGGITVGSLRDPSSFIKAAWATAEHVGAR